MLLTPTERAVAAAWEGALGVRGVGRRDHFFELGGSSVTAVRMLRLLGEALQTEGVDGAAHGDAFERGNQRFATRLCGLYRRPRLRDRLRDRPRRGRRLYDDDELDEDEDEAMRLRVMRVDAGRR